jgi:hypothetical protein
MAAMPPDSLMSFREVIDLTQDLMEQLLTPSEFAAVEHLGSRTVLRRVANGELQCVRIGREVFIWVGEVKSTPRTEAALLRTAMVRQVSPVVRPKKAPTPPKAPSTRGTRIPEQERQGRNQGQLGFHLEKLDAYRRRTRPAASRPTICEPAY